MKNKRITAICLGLAMSMTVSGTALAESDNAQLLAYKGSQKDNLSNANDEIFAALQALDEVGALIKDETESDKVDVDALLAAANMNTTSGTMKSYKVDEPEPVDVQMAAKLEPAKHDIQTAPVKSEQTETVAVKHDIQTAPMKSEQTETVASKHNVQTAPVKSEQTETVAAKHNVQTAPVKSGQTVASKTESTKSAAKHNVQTAPVKSEQTETVAAKHNVQTAPVKSGQTVASKTESTKSAAKHNVQTAPVKSATKTEASKSSVSAQAVKNSASKTELKDTPQSMSLAYVTAVYRTNGVDLNKVPSRNETPTIAELYQYAFTQKLVYQSTKPAIGDLAFFHNTVDRNRDGRWNDWHSMVGIVESVDEDQTISVLVYQKDKIERISLNLKYPEIHKGRKGQLLNSQLRDNEGAHKGTAAKLFAGFANLLGDATSVTVIDNWNPGMKLSK